ncbi:hypothetical protein SESBI_08213 [Sesbania bispinosa]|nr:hypothetical protein SESBI_08213 [Sesbania bispinosa]
MESHPSPNSQTPGPGDHDDDPAIIIYDDEDVNEGISTCSRSLVGKIITEKPIHTNSLQNALAGIWCNPRGFKIEEIKNKTFQFFFNEGRDAERVLKGNSWLFRNSWLVLQRWERGQNIEDMDFSKIPIKNSNVAENEEEEDKSLGPWIRASQIGRKVTQNLKDYHEEASVKRQGSKKTQLSNDVLAKLSALSIAKEPSVIPPNTEPSPSTYMILEKRTWPPSKCFRPAHTKRSQSRLMH